MFDTRTGCTMRLISFILPDSIQRRLEVIEDDGVGKAFEYKWKLPERIDWARLEHRRDGQNVDNDKGHAEAHA